jgi:tetratricopeptide (TPR) repeat protein
MLNNDFKVLVQKHERYKLTKRKSRNRKILFFIILAAIGYYLFTRDFSQKSSQEFNSSKIATTIPKTEINETKKVVSKPAQKQHESNSTKTTKKEKNQTKQPKVNQLRLQVTTKKDSLNQLLENQEKYKNYSSTIAIANYHYSKKAYKEAIKWAIEANKKNKSKARPWIIYAKSKKALGNEKSAKKALTHYLKRYPSQEVQELLNSL